MNLRILIVSQDKEKIVFYKSLFIDLGQQPSSAAGAFEALRVFINYNKYGAPFDLVFTDYILPGMNGINLARRLLAIYPDVNLVLFPQACFYETGLYRDYAAFGGFMQETPDDSFLEYRNIIDCTLHKKAVLKKTFAGNCSTT